MSPASAHTGSKSGLNFSKQCVQLILFFIFYQSAVYYFVDLLVTDVTLAKAVLHCTHPVSHVIFRFMENQQRQSKTSINRFIWLVNDRNVNKKVRIVAFWWIFNLRKSKMLFWLLTTFHNSVTRDEQTHRFPSEGPNSIEILV